MAVKTLYVTNTAATSPGWFGTLSETQPGLTNSSFGWAPGAIAAGSYARSRLGAATASTSVSASSFISGASGPTAGTGATNTTAGDSFRAGPFTGIFAATQWSFDWTMRATTTGMAGAIGMRVWKSLNQDGSGATELTSGEIFSSFAGINTSDTLVQILWTPGSSIALAGHYLFFQLEWQQQAITGTAGNNALFRVGVAAVTTSNFAASAALTATNLAVSAPVVPSATLGVKQARDLIVSSPVLGSTSIGFAETGWLIFEDGVTALLLNTGDIHDHLGLMSSGTFTHGGTDHVAPAMAIGSPVFDAPVMAVIINPVLVNLIVSSPAIDAGVLGQQHGLVSIDLTTSAPVLDSAVLVRIVAIAVENLNANVPDIGIGAIKQAHLLSAANLAIAPPAEGSPSLSQSNTVSVVSLTTSVPVIGTSTITNVTVNATAVGIAPTSVIIGAGVLSQKHVFVGVSFAVQPPAFTVPAMAISFWLSDRVRDFGLDILRSEADKIIVCSAPPVTYADAQSFKVGEHANTFAPPSGATDGRKIASDIILTGAATSVGPIRRWAVIDTANSRLLAHGPVAGNVVTSLTFAWALDPLVIDQPRG